MTAPKKLDRPIAWVCETYESGGRTEVRVVREGMTREEIVEEFARGDGYNRAALCRAIIYEAYREVVEEGRARPRGNIRSFWYERLFHTLVAVMGETNMHSVANTVGDAWRDLVEGGWVSYRALNLYSERENQYHVAVSEDSPYPTVVVFVEKAALFEPLRDIADTYEVSFVAAGGQNSRAAAMSYVNDLERLGVDPTQDFTVFSFADFDPEGWQIPRGFVDHLRLKVTGGIRLVRLGLLREQLGESVVEHQAIPYSLEADTERVRKAKRTKWRRFERESGGLYIRDRGGQLVPGRVELNIYTAEQIRERILSGLAEEIDGFPYQVRELKEQIGRQYDRAWKEYASRYNDGVDEVYEPYFDAIEDRYWELENARARRTADESEQIAKLRERIAELQAAADDKASDIDERMKALGSLQNDLQERAAREHVDPYTARRVGLEPSDHFEGIPESEELVEAVEQNGGWGEWIDELGIDRVDGRALADAAREHDEFDWQPSRAERRSIRDWILAEYPDLPSAEAPDCDPADLVADV